MVPTTINAMAHDGVGAEDDAVAVESAAPSARATGQGRNCIP
jgi:hypothetical protein